MRVSVVILLSFLSFSAFGQTFKQYVKAGDKSMIEGDYYSAMIYFQDAAEIKEDNAGVQYKCGEAARQFFSYETAEVHFEKAKKIAGEGELPLLNLYLADVKQTLGKYDEAAELYKAYFDAGIGDEMNMELAEMGQASCGWAKEQQRNAEIMTRAMEKTINSRYSEFGGSWKSKELYFSSLKFKDETVKEDRRLSKILSTEYEDERGKSLRIKGIPEDTNVGNTTFDDKGNMYFTVCDYVDATYLRCDIYYAEHDGKRWISEKLENLINQEEYTQTQPAWSNHKDWKGLFFSSNRPEGKGGMDIWFAKHKGADVFEEPINIAAVNTPFNEITPSFDKGRAEAKLYFSSDGYVGFGKYDIYESKHNGKEWTAPENMGMPINSGYNDVYFWKNSKLDKALLSSNRLESRQMIKGESACCNDLYKVTFLNKEPEPETTPEPEIVVIEKPQPKPTPKPVPRPKPTPVIVSTPKPVPTPKPIPVKTTVTLQSLLPLKVYFDNDEPDKRTYKTRTIKSYTQSYNEYILRESVFYDKYVEGLSLEYRSEALANLVGFFNNDVRKGYADLQTASFMILSNLELGKNITIQVKGYTSPRAKSTYNQNLAQRRTSSLLNYFNQFLDGAFLSYIQSGQLRIIELPIGETTAPTDISDSLTDEKNSIYSPGASEERRAEVVAVKIE
jgi:tetratricopeptide (TPR) repeat protein